MSFQPDALYQGLNNLSHFTLSRSFKQRQAKDCTSYLQCSNWTQCLYLSSRLNLYYSAACKIIRILSQHAFNLSYDYLNMSFFGVDFIMCYQC